MERFLAVTAFWLSLILAGLLLGAAEEAVTPAPPKRHAPMEMTTTSTTSTTTKSDSMTVNWDAISALAVIAFGFVSGTWFVVSMAINSAMDSRFEKFRKEMHEELNDPDTGFVLSRECKLLHERTREELVQLREQAMSALEKLEQRGDN
jgi:hypothetical protein